MDSTELLKCFLKTQLSKKLNKFLHDIWKNIGNCIYQPKLMKKSSTDFSTYFFLRTGSRFSPQKKRSWKKKWKIFPLIWVDKCNIVFFFKKCVKMDLAFLRVAFSKNKSTIQLSLSLELKNDWDGIYEPKFGLEFRALIFKLMIQL